MDDTLGQRIRHLRDRRRMSQQQLAVAADVSVDLIRKLEQGQRHSARLDTITRLAAGLDAPIHELLGVAQGLAAEHSGHVAALRAAIYGAEPADGQLPGLDTLHTRVVDLSELYWAGKFTALTEALPPLLTTARAAAQGAGTAQRREHHGVLAEVLQLAASLVTHLGYDDLGHVALLQALPAAETAEDPLLRAAQQASQAWVLSRQGLWSQAERLAAAAASEVEPVLSNASVEQIAVWGELCHFATIALARDGREREAAELLGLVQAAGAAIGGRQSGYSTMIPFGPTFAAHSAVAVAVATDRPRDALRLAPQVEEPQLLPPSIHGRFLLNIAWAQVVEWRSQEALYTLQQVDTLAPELLDHHGLARAIVEELIPRRRTQRLVGLAALSRRVGIGTE